MNLTLCQPPPDINPQTNPDLDEKSYQSPFKESTSPLRPKFHNVMEPEVKETARMTSMFSDRIKKDNGSPQKNNSPVSKRPTSPINRNKHKAVEINNNYNALKTDYKAKEHEKIVQNIKENNFAKKIFKEHVGKVRCFAIQDNQAVIRDDEGVKLLDLESEVIRWTYPCRHQLGVINRVKIAGNHVFFESYDKPDYTIRELDLQTGEDINSENPGKIENNHSEELSVQNDPGSPLLANANFMVMLYPDRISIHDTKPDSNSKREIPFDQLFVSSASLEGDRLACGYKEKGKLHFCIVDLNSGKVEKYLAPNPSLMPYQTDENTIDRVILKKQQVYLLYSTGKMVKVNLDGGKSAVLRDVRPKKLESKIFSVVVVDPEIFVYDKKTKRNKKFSIKNQQLISSVDVDHDRLVCGLIDNEGKPCFCVMDLKNGKEIKYTIPNIEDSEQNHKYIIDKVVLHNEKVSLTFSSGKEAQFDLNKNSCDLVNDDVDIKKTSLNSDQFLVTFSPKGITVYDKQEEKIKSIPLENKSITCANIYHDQLVCGIIEKKSKVTGFFTVDLKSGEIKPYRTRNFVNARIDHVVLNGDWACLGYTSGLIIAANLSTGSYKHLGMHENVSYLSIDGDILVSASKKRYTSDDIQPKFIFWDLKSKEKIRETGFVGGHALAIDSGNFYAAVGNSFIQLDYLASPLISENSLKEDEISIPTIDLPAKSDSAEVIRKNLNKAFGELAVNDPNFISRHPSVVGAKKPNTSHRTVLNGHSGKVNAFHINKDKSLVVACDDEKIVLWDVKSKKHRWSVDNIFGPDTTNKVDIIGNYVFFESTDSNTKKITLRIFKLNDGREVNPKSDSYKQLIEKSEKSYVLLNEEKNVGDSFYEMLSNNDFLISLSDKTITITNIVNNEQKEIHLGDDASISSAFLDNNGLVCGFKDLKNNIFKLYAMNLKSDKAAEVPLPASLCTKDNRIESIVVHKSVVYLGLSSGEVVAFDIKDKQHKILGRHLNGVVELVLSDEILVSASKSRKLENPADVGNPSLAELRFWNIETMKETNSLEFPDLQAFQYGRGSLTVATGESLEHYDHLDQHESKKVVGDERQIKKVDPRSLI